MQTKQPEPVDFSTDVVCLKSREVMKVTVKCRMIILSQPVEKPGENSASSATTDSHVILILCSVAITHSANFCFNVHLNLCYIRI